MSTDTNILRPEVLQALHFIEHTRVFVTSRQRIKKPEGDDLFDASIAIIRAELLRLARDYKETVRKAAERSLDGYRELGARAAAAEERAERAEAELAALRARIEASAVGTLDVCYNGHEPAFIGFPQPFEHDTDQDLIGQRVRLVVEDGDD